MKLRSEYKHLREVEGESEEEGELRTEKLGCCFVYLIKKKKKESALILSLCSQVLQINKMMDPRDKTNRVVI